MKLHLLTLVLALATGLVAVAESVTCHVHIDQAVLPADQPHKAVVMVTLEPGVAPRRETRPPVNLAIVLDRSGSMQGEKIAQARAAAIEILQRLDARDTFSLVTYSSGAETVVPARSATDLATIIAQIRGITAGGSTALFAGVSQGANEVRKHIDADRVNRIVLLSDGLANVGPSSPTELGRLGAALIKEGIAVTTVGVGLDYNEDLMTQLSQKSDGNSYFAKSADELPAIFNTELGDVLNVVASKVRIEIHFAPGYKPLQIIGREGRIEDNRVYLQLNQLYSTREKSALVEVEVTPAAGTHVATARCGYRDMLKDADASTSSELQVRFSEDAAAQEASRNHKVVAQHALLVSAVAQDESITLVEQGQKGQAVQQLRLNSINLRKVGEETRQPSLIRQADDLEEQAEQIDKKGLSKQQRKEMRQGSFDVFNDNVRQ